MESDNEMKELMQAMMAISAKNQTIKAGPFSGKQEDFPKWRLNQKQHFISANMAHVLDPGFMRKLPSSKTMELDENDPDDKQFAKYWWQNAKAAAVLIAAQESMGPSQWSGLEMSKFGHITLPSSRLNCWLGVPYTVFWSSSSAPWQVLLATPINMWVSTLSSAK